MKRILTLRPGIWFDLLILALLSAALGLGGGLPYYHPDWDGNNAHNIAILDTSNDSITFPWSEK